MSVVRELVYSIDFRGNIERLRRINEQVSSSTSQVTNRLNALGSSLSNISNRAGKIGNSLSLKVTTPLMLVGKSIIQTSKNFGYAMSEVQAISGASADEFNKLKNVARQMGATTKFSATDSANALKYMAQSGWDTQKMVEGLPGVMKLAAASGEDLALSSSIVTSSMTAFGIHASKSAMFADVLAQAANASNTGVAEMGETFKYVGPVAGALKYSIQDMAIATGLMANVNVKGSQAGTALRAAISNMVKPTRQMQTAMDELGISLTDSQGKMKPFKTVMDDMRKGFSTLSEEQKSFYAATIFGDTAMSGMLGIINASEEDYKKLGSAIYDAAGAADKAAKIMNDNLQGDMDSLSSAVEELSLQVGEILTPYLRKGVQYLNSVVAAIGKLDDNTKLTILKMVGLAAALGPMFKLFQFATAGASVFFKTLGFLSKYNIVFLFTKIGSGLAKLKAGFIALKALGIKGVFAAIATAGLPIIATIGLLVAAGVILYKNWDTVKGKGIEFINSLKDKFSVFVPDAIALFENLKQIFLSLLPAFAGVIGGIGGGLGSLLGTIGSVIGSAIKIFKGITEFLLGAFTGDWDRAFKGIFDIVSGVVEAIKSIFGGVIDFFSSVINGFKSGVAVGEETAAKVQGTYKTTKNITSVPKALGPVRQDIPYFAKGVENFRGGLAIVGEQGPELVHLPAGSSVKSNNQTKSIFKNNNIMPFNNALNGISRKRAALKFDGAFKASHEIYKNSNTTKNSRTYNLSFSPHINITTNSDNPNEVAEVSKNTIRSYFEEWVDEALYAS